MSLPQRPPAPPLHLYKAYYKTKTLELRALTSLAAQVQAAKLFKAKHSYLVDVYLLEKADGAVNEISTASL